MPGRHRVPVLPCGVTAQSPLPLFGARGYIRTLGSLLVVVGPCSSWSLLLHRCLDVPALSTAQDPAKQSRRQPRHPVPQFPHLQPESPIALGHLSCLPPAPAAWGESLVRDHCP